MPNLLIDIVAPAPAEALAENPGLKGSDSWGWLHIKYALSDTSSWTFSPFGPVDYLDDFWGFGEFEMDNSDRYRPRPRPAMAEGYSVNQLNMNLHLWSTRPRHRLAMMLLGFHQLQIRVGTTGVGTIFRGRAIKWIDGNPVAGPGRHKILDDSTDGQSVPLRWTVLDPWRLDYGVRLAKTQRRLA